MWGIYFGIAFILFKTNPSVTRKLAPPPLAQGRLVSFTSSFSLLIQKTKKSKQGAVMVYLASPVQGEVDAAGRRKG